MADLDELLYSNYVGTVQRSLEFADDGQPRLGANVRVERVERGEGGLAFA